MAKRTKTAKTQHGAAYGKRPIDFSQEIQEFIDARLPESSPLRSRPVDSRSLLPAIEM